jgi:hypothetical protein
MNSYYEFVLLHQHQLLETSRRAKTVQNCREKRYGSWGMVISRCGDLLITCGAWLKKISSSSSNKKSVGIYSRN